MTAQTLHPFLRAFAALALALGVHVTLAWGVLVMPRMNITPPQAVGGFEVVDLSAFGIAAVADPEPAEQETPKEKPIEEAKVEPEPEVVQETKPEPEPEIAAPQPVPQPVAQPKSKPEPKPNPAQTAEPKSKPVKQPQTATVGSQEAFVPPSSTAAYLRNPKPTYPALAQRRGMEGIVLLVVEVSVQGRPLSVSVKKGSGYSILDKAALRAVQAWRFAPATRGGQPVAASVEVPIRFILKDA